MSDLVPSPPIEPMLAKLSPATPAAPASFRRMWWWAIWLGPPLVAFFVLVGWLWLRPSGEPFAQSPVIFREDGRDTETMPLDQAFQRAAVAVGIEPLVPRRSAAEFSPLFVDAVKASPPYIVLGLVRSSEDAQINATIVQTDEYTSAPVDKAPTIELGIEGLSAWTPPTLPVVLNGRSYYQYIARTSERQLILSIETTVEPSKDEIRDLFAAMLVE